MRQWLGSIVFTLYLFVSVAIYGALVLLFTWPLPRRATYRAVLPWARSVMFMLRHVCRLDYVVEGREHVTEGTVVLMKHSSAWETIAQLLIFPNQTWVIKRELMWAPVLGWVLALLKPIAINRKGGATAVQQVVAQGCRRLEEGFAVMIFPEGTRMSPGQTRRYGLSGAVLASAAGRPVIPVAHNAGEFWPRRGWLKRPGTIRMVIGPPIGTADLDPRAINERAQRWIEAKVAEISGRPVASTGGAAEPAT